MFTIRPPQNKNVTRALDKHGILNINREFPFLYFFNIPNKACSEALQQQEAPSDHTVCRCVEGCPLHLLVLKIAFATDPPCPHDTENRRLEADQSTDPKRPYVPPFFLVVSD